MSEQLKENQEKEMEQQSSNQDESESEQELAPDLQESTEENDSEEKLKQTVEELQNRLLRSQADFENYKKRTRIEKEEIAKYSSAKIIESLLPAYDNLERALQSSNETNNFESLVQGVDMVFRQIRDALAQEGLETIEAVGHPFNPELHQAVMQVETDEYDSGIVVEELQKGYKLKEKVIRPSMVKVNA